MEVFAINFTNVFSLIGCVTGVLSLFMSLSLFFVQYPKVKIKLSSNDNAPPPFFFSEKDFFTPDLEFNDFETNQTYKRTGCDVMLEITNTSIHPLTVVSISARYSRRFFPFSFPIKSDNFSFSLNKYIHPETKRIFDGHFFKTELPFRIQPLDTKNVGVRFPISLDKIRKNKLHIYVYTPSRVSHIKAKLLPYDKAINPHCFKISKEDF